MEMRDRIKALRAQEPEVYGICMHLLQNEEAAIEAAKSALSRLFACRAYFESNAQERLRLAKRTAIRCAMEIWSVRRSASS